MGIQQSNEAQDGAAETGVVRRSGKLSQAVYDDLLDKIASGTLAAGTLLPREEQYAAELGVSRTVLREALAQLRHDGLIDSKRGTGNRVVGPPPARTSPIFEPGPPASIAELEACFEFRLGVEPGIAALAALRASGPDLDRIETAAAAFELAATSGELGAAEDIAFHTAITAASGNSFYMRTIAAIAVPVEVGMQIARALTMRPSAERLRTTMEEHRAIVAALRARDPEGASEAMRQHIESSKFRVFQGPGAV